MSIESITVEVFEAILSVLEVSFEFMESLSSNILLFLSSFVSCSLCPIFNVYGATNALFL